MSAAIPRLPLERGSKDTPTARYLFHAVPAPEDVSVSWALVEKPESRVRVITEGWELHAA